MSRSIKFRNDVYLDSSNIIHKDIYGLHKRLVDILYHNDLQKKGTFIGNTTYKLNLDLSQFCEISIILIDGIYATQVIKAICINYVAYGFYPIIDKTIGRRQLCTSISRTGSGELTFNLTTSDQIEYEIKRKFLRYIT